MKANGKANGAAIRAIRVAKGISLRTMAEATDYDRGALSKIENGLKDASNEALAVFSAYLEVPLDAISNPPTQVLIQATPENIGQIAEMVRSLTGARL